MDIFELKDKAAREIIANDLKANMLVEAGAGSGKTQEMAERILAAINTGYRKINEIVAITFTKKAANELRERIRLTLKKEYEKTGSELQKAALDHIHECFIGTIHSFCGKILRERPIEAGIDPGFEEIDEPKDQMLLRTAWETYVTQADAYDKTILQWMDVFGVREDSAKGFLQTVCENRDVNFQLPDEKVAEPDKIIDEIRKVLKEIYDLVKANYSAISKDVIDGNAKADGLQKSMMLFRKKARGTKLMELSNKALVDLLKIFTTKTSTSITQKNWGDDKAEKDRAKAIRDHFQYLQESSILPLSGIINASVYNHLLIPFAKKAGEIYTQHKRAVAELNFQDLLMTTSQLLRDYPEVRTYFQSKYKTLLIDEFQDTDPIQTEIAMYLTGTETGEKKWHKITPLEGSLFVVGDPKQSIYGFRRADFRLYKRFKEHIVSVGGKVVELHTNFRSTDELGIWYDNAFSVLLDGEDQASFTDMDTVMPSKDDTLTGVAYYRIDALTIENIIAAEPPVLIDIINYMVGRKYITFRKKDDAGNSVLDKRKVTHKDIMVLAMKKRLLEPVANAVAASGIPVRITGADITKRTSEFTSFAELIRMLAYPEENAYVYNVMRSDFFGFTAREIYRYRNRGGDFSIYFDFEKFFRENRLKEGIKGIFEKVRDCFNKLQTFTDYVQNLSPAAATGRIIEDLGIMRVHLTSNEKLAGFGSFVSLVEKVRMKKVTDVWGLNLFIQELSFMIENGFEEDIDIEGKDVDAVRFMNVHKAKGLEAPIIILCGPCSGKMPDPTFYTELVTGEDGSEENYGYVRVNKNPDSFSKSYFEPLAWSTIEQKAVTAERLERDRLLYVAATRARNYLIISDSAARSKPWTKLIDLLPEGKTNIFDEIYKDEAFSEDAEGAGDRESKKETLLLSAGEADKSLSEVKRRRDDAFNANKATYRVYTPSQVTGRLSGSGSDDAGIDLYELEKTITENTMEVVIYGEEASIKAGKLSIGTIIHKVFETLITDEPALTETIDMILEGNVDEFITKELLLSIVDEFKKKPLWERIKKSEKVYTEVPFSYKAPESEVYAGDVLSEDTYVNGIIDLVFKEQNGWVIIDYKSYDEHEVSQDIRRNHEKQLESYKEAWEKITGEPVKETEIFFVRKRIVV